VAQAAMDDMAHGVPVWMLNIGETTIERRAPGLFDFSRILCGY
jgi:hypothetical protein